MGDYNYRGYDDQLNAGAGAGLFNLLLNIAPGFFQSDEMRRQQRLGDIYRLAGASGGIQNLPEEYRIKLGENIIRDKEMRSRVPEMVRSGQILPSREQYGKVEEERELSDLESEADQLAMTTLPQGVYELAKSNNTSDPRVQAAQAMYTQFRRNYMSKAMIAGKFGKRGVPKEMMLSLLPQAGGPEPGAKVSVQQAAQLYPDILKHGGMQAVIEAAVADGYDVPDAVDYMAGAKKSVPFSMNGQSWNIPQEDAARLTVQREQNAAMASSRDMKDKLDLLQTISTLDKTMLEMAKSGNAVGQQKVSMAGDYLKQISAVKADAARIQEKNLAAFDMYSKNILTGGTKADLANLQSAKIPYRVFLKRQPGVAVDGTALVSGAISPRDVLRIVPMRNEYLRGYIGDPAGNIIIDPQTNMPYRDPAFIDMENAYSTYQQAFNALALNPMDPQALQTMEQVMQATQELLQKKGIPLQQKARQMGIPQQVDVPPKPATAMGPLPTTSNTTSTIPGPFTPDDAARLEQYKQQFNLQ